MLFERITTRFHWLEKGDNCISCDGNNAGFKYIPTTGAEDIIKKAIVVVAGAVGAGVACLPDYLYVTSVLSMHKSVGKIYYVYENDYYLDSNKSQLIGHWTFRHRSGH